MSGFRDIVGHEKIIAHLQEAIFTGKVSHAYILDGPADSGKRMLAEAFAQALQCTDVQKKLEWIHSEQTGQSENGQSQTLPNLYDRVIWPSQIDACGQCRSCHQALGHNQPDILYVTHEKPNTISVKDVREQMNGTVGIRPYSSRYKIYIVDEAEKMNVQGQNALLKTIEEPPAYAIFLLLTENADSFLPTIRSRCVTLRLQAVSEDKIRTYLMRHCQVPDYQADMCASFSQGNVGRAISLASSEDFNDLKNTVVSHMKKMSNVHLYELEDLVKELADSTEQTEDYLDLVRLWFRDVLLYKCTASTEQLIYSDQIRAIDSLAENCTYRGLSQIFDAIETARARLHSNVNRDLALEILLMTIREKCSLL